VKNIRPLQRTMKKRSVTTQSNTRSSKPVTKATPQYEADNGPLSARQIRQINKLVPQGDKRLLRSNLLDGQHTQNK